MTRKTAITALLCSIGLAIIIWLIAGTGLLSTFTSDPLTRAPDKQQQPVRIAGTTHVYGQVSAETQTSAAPQTAAAGKIEAPASTTARAAGNKTHPQQSAEQRPARSETKPRYTTSHTVNIRSGAGSGHAVVGQVKPGEQVTLLDRSGKWLHIQAGAMTGWVYKSLFTPVQPDTTAQAQHSQPQKQSQAHTEHARTQPNKAYTTSHTVNLRAGPGTGYRAVGTVHPGETVTLSGHSKGQWMHVKHGRQSGWVYKKLFKKTGR